MSGLRGVSLEGWLLAGLVVAYCGTAMAVGRARPLWFDELITLWASHEPTWRQMFLAERADGNPPLMFVLTRLSVGAFGANAFALRLPALVGMVTALVCCYGFVARRVGGASGLMAAGLLVCSGVSVYGYEGRPYGLVLGLTALLLVLWQRATEREAGDVRALVAVGVATFALVIAHPFGVLYALAPVGVGEGVRWWRERRVDGGMLGAMVWGASGMAIALPLSVVNRRLLVGAAGGVPAVAAPSVAMLRAVKHLALGGVPWVVMVPLVAVSLLSVRMGWAKEGEARSGVPWHEWAAVASLVLLGPMMWLMARGVTHYFFQRYTVVAALGVSMGLAMMCARVPRGRVVLPVVALAMMGVHEARAWRAVRRKPDAADGALLQGLPVGEPIVMASPLEYARVWWYSDAKMRMRIHILCDEEMAAKTADFIPEFYLAAQEKAGLLPFAMESPEAFLAGNTQFLVVSRQSGVFGGEWVMGYLREKGYAMTPVREEEGGELVLYEVSKMCMEVHV